ncbi:MAG TPA: DUF2231 domain-containing protein [Burkholderiaceae bacterium]|nr:DUF2231 domain-containing protein [Burkholderiaceae bacterium]
MAVIVHTRYSEAIHPLHAVLLSGAFTLFLSALMSDIAYAKTFHIQWSNFASWLIVGGLLFASLALVFALVDLCRAQRRVPGIAAYFVLLLATWLVGFFNALMHARDAWAMMPGGLILSIVGTLLAALTTWLGFRTPHFVRSVR